LAHLAAAAVAVAVAAVAVTAAEAVAAAAAQNYKDDDYPKAVAVTEHVNSLSPREAMMVFSKPAPGAAGTGALVSR